MTAGWSAEGIKVCADEAVIELAEVLRDLQREPDWYEMARKVIAAGWHR